MATQIGTAHVFGGSGATTGIATLSGYVSPNMQTLRATHQAEIDKVRGQGGDTTGLISSDDNIECTFEFIPEGSTIAGATASSGVPAALAGVTIAGLPIIACGPFVDSLNTNGTNTQPWIYEKGAQIHGQNKEKWTLTLPLMRYPLITSATALT